MELQSDHDEEMQRMGQIRRKAPAFGIEYKGNALGEDEPFSGRKTQLLIVGSACQSPAVVTGLSVRVSAEDEEIIAHFQDTCHWL